MVVVFKKLLIIFIFAIVGTSVTFSAPDDWYIEGDHVKLDDALVRFDVWPHTTIGGDIYINFTSKVYSGNIDFAFLFDADHMKPTSGQYDNNGQWNNLPKPNKVSVDYDGFDRAYILQNLPINSNKDYLIKITVDVAFNTSGKYGIAFKPSSKTIAQAIADGQFYYLDPWFNSSTTDKRRVDVNGTGLTNSVQPFPCLVNGTSGVTVGGFSRQGIWTNCTAVNGSFYMYYSDETDLQFVNEDEDQRLANIVIKGSSPNYTDISNIFNSTVKFLYLGRNNGSQIYEQVQGQHWPNYFGTPDFIETDVGWGVEQDASNAILQGAAAGDLDINGTQLYAFTYVDWTNPTAHGNGMSVIDQYDTSGSNDRFSCGAWNGQARFLLQIAGSTGLAQASNQLSAGNHTIICTYDGAAMRLYVDGVLNVTTAKTGTLPEMNGRPCFGGDIASGTTCSTAAYVPGIIHIVGAGEHNVTQDWVLAFDQMMRSPGTMFTTLASETQPGVLAIGVCGGSLDEAAYTFTFADEATRTQLSDYDFDGYFEAWTTDISNRTNATISLTNQTSIEICTTDPVITINATVEYTNDTSTEREYYLSVNQTLNGSAYTPVLYNLPSGDVTTTQIIVTGSDGKPKQDVVVVAQRYYIAINAWVTVNMAKTDFSGTSVMKLVDTRTQDPSTIYRFVIYDNGNLIYTSPQTKLVSDATTGIATFSINLQATVGTVYTVINNAITTCSNTSDTLTCTYASTSLSSVNLTISRVIGENLTIQCSNTSTGVSGSVQCALSGTINGTYLYTMYGTFTNNLTSVIASGALLFNPINTLGTLGLIGAFLLTTMAALLGSRIGSAAVIIGAVAGVILSALMGFVVLDGTVLMFIAIIGLVLLILMRDR